MMIKKISEDTIEQYINEKYATMSLPDIYFTLKKQVDKQKNGERFYSLESNFTPIFLYFAIEKKCSLTDFTKILQISENYEQGLDRFFHRTDCDYNESKTSHIYDKMSYLFYKQNGDGIIFDEEKIPYIKEIIKNVRLQNLLEFHSSRIDNFLAHIINKDQKVGKEILEAVASSTFMWIEEPRQYSNMISSLIHIFSNDNYSRDISHIYALFKEKPYVYNEIKKNIISLSLDKIAKYKTNLAIYKMVTDNEENYFVLVEDRLKELKEKIARTDYIELIEDSIYAFETGVQHKPVELDLGKIKPSNNIVDNMPYLIILQELIKAGQYNYIVGNNEQLNQYLISQQQNSEKNFEDKVINIKEYMMIDKIEFDQIEKFLNYRKFNNKYTEKPTKISKNKI